MFKLFKFHSATIKIIKIYRLHTAAITSLRKQMDSSSRSFQYPDVPSFRKRNTEEHYKNTFNISPILFTLGLGLVFCKYVTLNNNEKRLFKTCQFGLSHEVKR